MGCMVMHKMPLFDRAHLGKGYDYEFRQVPNEKVTNISKCFIIIISATTRVLILNLIQ